jgi:excisionase family DNA binding protein
MKEERMNQQIKYTIDQVAEIVGVHKSTLRYWGKVFGIETPRSEGRQRRYPVEQVELLKTIKQHYDAGYSTRGVRMQLEEASGTA